VKGRKENSPHKEQQKMSRSSPDEEAMAFLISNNKKKSHGRKCLLLSQSFQLLLTPKIVI
jgi:hypothetical protein